MSQSEFTARRMATGAEAAKGWESFLWEQRIDNSWRILFTIGLLFSVKPFHGRLQQGSAHEAGECKLSAGRGHARRVADRDGFLGGAVHFFLLSGLPDIDRALEPGAVLDAYALANYVAPE